MKIDLTELLSKPGNETDIEKSVEVNFAEDGLSLTQPVKVSLHLTNTGSSVLLDGKIETVAELECARCLESFELPLKAEVAEEFSQEVVARATKKVVELKKEDFVYPIESDNSINLTELIRQELLLALPIKLLCLKDCQGITKEEK